MAFSTLQFENLRKPTKLEYNQKIGILTINPSVQVSLHILSFFVISYNRYIYVFHKISLLSATQHENIANMTFHVKSPDFLKKMLNLRYQGKKIGKSYNQNNYYFLNYES